MFGVIFEFFTFLRFFAALSLLVAAACFDVHSTGYDDNPIVNKPHKETKIHTLVL